MKRIFRLGGALTCLAAALLAIGLSACGGSDDSTSSSSSGASTEAGSTESGSSDADAAVAKAEKYLEENGKGVGGPLPTEPAKAPPGKDVWILSCAEAASGCQTITAGIKEAAEEVGWKTTVVDGAGDVTKWNSAVDQARVAGADAFFAVSVDCAPIKQALERAKASGMITEGVSDYDCSDPLEGGTEPLFTHVFEGPFKGPESWAKLGEAGGGLQAAWDIVNIEGDKKAIQFTSQDVAVTQYISKGFEENFDCPECEIVGEVPFQLTELGATLTQKAQTAMLKYPDANIMAPPYDPVSENIAAAIVNSGKVGSITNTGLLASPPNIDLIRSGRGQEMSVGWDSRWFGWAAVDDVIRLFNGQEPVYSGWDQGIVDKDNLPEGDTYVAPVDYISNYKKLWGLG
ncbi:MAG: ribose transport system substrate-binding protein [Solirubrobacterales bacterium]|nr:ribose transport system substrate-binding protein [Solirubrobacterales bacterium]